MMESKISLHLIFAFVIGILMFPQTALAQQSIDDSKIIASSKATNTLGKKPAGEIIKENAKKSRIKKKRQDNAARKLKYISKIDKEFQGLNPVEKKLIKELPYEVRKQLKDIPKERRTDWMIDRIVERKAPMVAKHLCRNERFKKAYENASKEDKPKLLKHGLKRQVLGAMRKSQDGGYDPKRDSAPQDFIKKMNLEQRRKLMRAPKEEKLDLMTDQIMKQKREEIKRQIENNPELKKKLKEMPEDKRVKYIRDQIKKQIEEKMGKEGFPKQGRGPDAQKQRFQNAPDFIKKMDPETRRKFMQVPPEKKLDFLTDQVIKNKGDDIRRMIKENPELQKKLEKVPPEKRKDAIRRMIRGKIQQKLQGKIEQNNRPGSERGDQQKMRKRAAKQGQHPGMDFQKDRERPEVRSRKGFENDNKWQNKSEKKRGQKGMKRGQRRGMWREQRQGNRQERGMQWRGMGGHMNMPPPMMQGQCPHMMPPPPMMYGYGQQMMPPPCGHICGPDCFKPPEGPDFPGGQEGWNSNMPRDNWRGPEMRPGPDSQNWGDDRGPQGMDWGWNPDREWRDQPQQRDRREMRDDFDLNIPPDVLTRLMEEPDLMREMIRRMPMDFKHRLIEFLEDNLREMERDEKVEK